MKYPEDFINKLICGNCLEVMKIMPDNCIETIITDPPYKIGFMGKDWDKLDDRYKEGEWIPCETCDGKGIVIEENVEIVCPDCLGGGYELNPKKHNLMQKWHYNWAKEALRVAKPGSTLLCFGGTRTYHRLACGIEDAGWVIKDCIMWLYGSGFPKATDISQMLDKDECRKQLEKKLGRKATKEEFKEVWERFRKVVGKYELPDVADGRRKKGWDCTNTTDVGVFGVSGQQNITLPATPEAILWNGWKSHGLKPAYEPILVCMKSNEGSYANNALKYGVAGLNIDGGRIPANDVDNVKPFGSMPEDKTDVKGWTRPWMRNKQSIIDKQNKAIDNLKTKGRYPANVIHDGSDEVVRLFPNTGTSYRPNSRRGKIKSEIYMNGIVRDGYPTAIGVNDSGSASRFFYCAKASKAERNRGCEGLEEKLKPSGGHGNQENDSVNKKLGSQKKMQNHHPTVKPLALMKYLCTLTKTPTGGIVLDPFCGSGTTLMACKETGRKYIGIEIEKEYVEIVKCRLGAIEVVLF